MKQVGYVLRQVLEEIRDLRRLLALPNISLSKFPDLEQAAKLAHQHSNILRARFGLQPLEFSIHDIRLIPQKFYDNEEVCYNRGKGGAFFSVGLRKAFIRFDEERNYASKYDRIQMAHVIDHEKVHGSMEKDGARSYSYDLNEGITESVARDIMEGGVARLFFSDEELRENRLQIRSMMPQQWNGWKVDERDIIIYDPRIDRSMGYIRIPELHLVEYLTSKRSCTFDEMARFAFSGDNEGLSKYMEERGIHLMDLASKLLVLKEEETK